MRVFGLNDTNGQAPQADPAAMPQPQPIPSAVAVQLITGPAGNWVVITILDATGQRVLFVDPDAAQTIGGQIRAAGKQAKSGLIVPPGGGFIIPGPG